MSIRKHALIFGASGISGYALLNQAQVYPTSTTFSRITGTTSRPLRPEEAHLTSYDSSRVQLINGVDLTRSAAEVGEALSSKLNDVQTVTHVFFTAYIETSDFASLVSTNVNLLRNAITAVDRLCPSLELVILQTGGKAYGVEFPQHISIKPPLNESNGRIEKPWYDNIFYYPQCDVLAELSKGKRWTWAEVRPDVIVGYAPGTNAMNAAKGVGLWVLLHKAILGKGGSVPFPGTTKSWKNLHTDTSQDILAQFEIHLALQITERGRSDFGKGRAYNIADAVKPVTWSEKWDSLCAYFGMKGIGPDDEGRPDGAAQKGQSIDEFVRKNKHRWHDVVKNADKDAVEKYQWPFLNGVSVKFDFDRHYDLSRSREIGFNKEVDTVQAFKTAFQRMQDAGLLPSS